MTNIQADEGIQLSTTSVHRRLPSRADAVNGLFEAGEQMIGEDLGNEFAAATDANFVVDRLHVVAYGVGGEPDFRGDLLYRQPSR